TINSGLAAGERVLDLIDQRSEIIEKPDGKRIGSFEDKIVLRDVHFSYDTKEVLRGISLTVEKGQTVALVGPSGGGKSTIIDLIPRFMDPDSGQVTFDGIDLKDLQVESLRSLIGLVNQESILFNDTIYNNIAFPDEHARPEDVEAAARIANAHDCITATEHGYHTNIGDRGAKLSGGQRQRICIARAVFRNPPIM